MNRHIIPTIPTNSTAVSSSHSTKFASSSCPGVRRWGLRRACVNVLLLPPFVHRNVEVKTVQSCQTWPAQLKRPAADTQWLQNSHPLPPLLPCCSCTMRWRVEKARRVCCRTPRWFLIGSSPFLRCASPLSHLWCCLGGEPPSTDPGRPLKFFTAIFPSLFTLAVHS